MSKYYLIKVSDNIEESSYYQERRESITNFIDDYMDYIIDNIELTKEELQEIECGMNKNSQDIINNEHLCKIVEKIRKVLYNV